LAARGAFVGEPCWCGLLARRYRPAMTFWIVIGGVLVVVLGAMAWMDRRTRARGASVRGDIGHGVARNGALGNPEAFRGGGENPSGGGY
jgi:hypothetical protein